MTSREALKEIECIYEHEESTQNPYDDPIGKKIDYKEEFDILRKLVERDTPIKPLKVNNTTFIYWCPKCDCSSIQRYDKHCHDCGQRLDWNEK